VREILQFYGTDICRTLDADYWLRQAEKFEKELPNQPDLIIFADMRFDNELAFVKKQGWCIRLEAYEGYVPNNEHRSEKDLDNSDFDLVLRPAFGELEKTAESALPLVLHALQKFTEKIQGAAPEETRHV